MTHQNWLGRGWGFACGEGAVDVCMHKPSNAHMVVNKAKLEQYFSFVLSSFPLKITKQVNCDACSIKQKHMSYKLLTQQKGRGASWDEEWQGVNLMVW